ncbi:MAG: hypothetical protein ABIP75_14530 [Pyrinomonadaceae bacterium]
MNSMKWFATSMATLTLAFTLAGSVAAQQPRPKVPIGTIEKIEAPPEPRDTSIATPTVKASLRYGIGETVPVASLEVLLLDQDLSTILSKAGLHGESGLDELHSYAVYRVYPDAEHAEFSKAARAAIEPHIIARVTTNEAGQAQFATVPAGAYKVVAVTKTRTGLAIWNEFIKVTAGVTTITLDHNNVELAN